MKIYFFLSAVDPQQDQNLQFKTVIISAIISTVGIILVAYLNNRSKKNTSSKIDESVGIPNGKGTLMRQAEQQTQNQLELMNKVYDISHDINTHIIESSEQREGLREALIVINEKLTSHDKKIEELNEKVISHIDWEENFKYATIIRQPPSPPKTK